MGGTDLPSGPQAVRIVNEAPNFGLQGIFQGPVYEIARRKPPSSEEVRAAEIQVKALAGQALPSRGAVPPGSRMRLAPNPMFTGRDSELRRIAETFIEPSVAVLSGIGGAGKTQIASEFVHRYGQFFTGVYWVLMSDSEVALGEVASCGQPGLLDFSPLFAHLSTAEQANLVLAEWSAGLPYLLVFDNCEDEQVLARWRPASGAARILVTSRRGRWDPALSDRLIPLAEFDRGDSVRLLRRYRSDLLDDSDLEAIAAEVGDLPLALHLAGSFLATYRHSRLGRPAGYLEQLRSAGILEHPSLKGEGSAHSPTGHELDLVKSIGVSLVELDPEQPVDREAVRILATAASLAPHTPIPRAFVLWTLLDEPKAESLLFAGERALGRLIALGLVEEQNDGSVRIHKLVGGLVCRILGDDIPVRNGVEGALETAFRSSRDEASPLTLNALAPHLRYVTLAAIPRGDIMAAKLASAVGHRYRMNRDHEQARHFDTIALELIERLRGVDTVPTAMYLNNLGYTHYYLKNYDQARAYLTRAADLYEKARDFGNMAAAVDNLGQVSEGQQRREEAIAHYQNALRLRSRHLGESHPDTAISMFNLASVLKRAGHLEMACELHEGALAIRRRAFQGPHRMIADDLIALGILYGDMGKSRESVELIEEGARMREQVLGVAHPSTLGAFGTLASAYSQTGDVDSVHRYLARATENRLGEKWQALQMNLFGFALWKTGDYRQARQYWQSALDLETGILGDEALGDKPLVLNNMGMILFCRGEFVQARQFFEDALSLQLSNGGARVVLTAKYLHNLGTLLVHMELPCDARARLEEAYGMRKRIFGADGVQTLQTEAELALLSMLEGDAPGALSLIRSVVGSCRQLYPKDRITARAIHIMGLVSWRNGDRDAARQAFEEALTLQEITMGPAHPEAAWTIAEQARLAQEDGRTDEARTLRQRAICLVQNQVAAEHPDLIRLRAELDTASGNRSIT
jgi:tetratricopeptide (TPR) repeat protein